jgi:hypothetical protein
MEQSKAELKKMEITGWNVSRLDVEDWNFRGGALWVGTLEDGTLQDGMFQFRTLWDGRYSKGCNRTECYRILHDWRSQDGVLGIRLGWYATRWNITECNCKG